MSELPSSWAEIKLGDAVDYGKTNKAEPTEIPDDAWLLELEDIEKDTSKLLVRVTFGRRKSKSTKNCFSAGDVLYGKLRPYLNKVIRADRDGFCTTEIVPIKANAAVDGGYLFHWVRHPRFLDYVTNVSHGLNMPRLGTDAGLHAPFILAPIEEQKRISSKLDVLHAKVDACRERLDRVPQILKKFREAVLEAAVSGRLTEEWRGGAPTEESWRSHTVGEVAAKVTDGEHITPKRAPSGKYLLSARNIRDGHIALDDVDYVDEAEFARIRRRCNPAIGDVLLSCSGSVGRAALVDLDDCYVMVRSAAMIRPQADRLIAKYLMYCFQSPLLQTQIKAKSSATAQSNIFLGAIKSLQLPVPEVEEQAEMVRRIEDLFAFVNSLERRHAEVVSSVEKLTPSVLAKAFRGKLVPQDPKDEPAGEMLERMRQVQASETEAVGAGRKHFEGQTARGAKTRGGRRLRAKSG